MSRNFELLERARGALQRTSLNDTRNGACSAPVSEGSESETTTQHLNANVTDYLTDCTLPSNGLCASAKKQLATLVQQVLSTLPGLSVAVVAPLDETVNSVMIAACAAEILSTQTKRHVCVVDTDLARPALHRCFQVGADPGLTELMVGSDPVRKYSTRLTSNLWLLPAGSNLKPGSLALSFEHLREKLHEVRQEFDYTIVHSPALLGSTDVPALGPWADGVVLVLEANVTRRERAQRAKDLLEKAGIPLLGAVLNNRTFPIPAGLYARL